MKKILKKIFSFRWWSIGRSQEADWTILIAMGSITTLIFAALAFELYTAAAGMEVESRPNQTVVVTPFNTADLGSVLNFYAAKQQKFAGYQASPLHLVDPSL